MSQPAFAPPRLANRPRRRRSLISLTPLIDVVFILLVFFMLASSFLDWRSIDLEPGAAAGRASGMEGSILIDVRQDGLRLSGETLSLEALAQRLEALRERDPDRQVLVRPEAGVPLQQTVTVLDRLSALGIRALSLIPESSR